jgi:hypothetical protein
VGILEEQDYVFYIAKAGGGCGTMEGKPSGRNLKESKSHKTEVEPLRAPRAPRKIEIKLNTGFHPKGELRSS